MNLKEAVEIHEIVLAFLKENRASKNAIQALETVLAAVKRADLTDGQINDMMPDDPSDVCESYYINGWINGARHVRDLLRGEGKG